MKKSTITSIIYIILVYLAVATDRQGIYNVTYMSKYYFGIVICIMFFLFLIIRQKNKIIINRLQLYVAKMNFLPIVIVYVYTIMICIFNRVTYEGFTSRAIGLVVYSLLAVIQAYIVYEYFGEKSIIYTFTAIVLSYLTSVIVAFKNGGINEFIKMVTDSNFHGSVLEMHEVAPIISLFLFYFLYLLYFKEGKRRTLLRNIFICIMILILSMKRILLIACILTMFIFLFLRKKEKRFLHCFAIMSVTIIFISYIYVYAIESGIMYIILDKYNINSMARVELWSGIKSQYKFSPLYLGRGLGYSSIWMDNNWQNLNIQGLNQTTGLHNDILKFYIDFGFIGTLIYFFNFLYLNTKRIYKKINHNAASIYFTLISLQIFIWFTDVVSLYHNFQWIFFLIIFSLLSLNKKYSVLNKYNNE